jgi:hypothetical protein
VSDEKVNLLKRTGVAGRSFNVITGKPSPGCENKKVSVYRSDMQVATEELHEQDVWSR